jgi:hypothetical protein
MVQMKLIRKRHKRYALLFTVSVCLAMRIGTTFMSEAGPAYAAVVPGSH